MSLSSYPELKMKSYETNLLVALDGLLWVAQGVVTVSQVPKGATFVNNGGSGGQLLQRGQLLLQVPDGVLEVAHVEAGDTQVAECLSLKCRILTTNIGS